MTPDQVAGQPAVADFDPDTDDPDTEDDPAEAPDTGPEPDLGELPDAEDDPDEAKAGAELDPGEDAGEPEPDDPFSVEAAGSI